MQLRGRTPYRLRRGALVERLQEQEDCRRLANVLAAVRGPLVAGRVRRGDSDWARVPAGRALVAGRAPLVVACVADDADPVVCALLGAKVDPHRVRVDLDGVRLGEGDELEGAARLVALYERDALGDSFSGKQTERAA